MLARERLFRVFFILTALTSSGRTGTDESRTLRALRERYHQQALFARQTEYDEPLLVYRMVWIRHQHRQGVSEHGASFVERHVVVA